jgi:hypothetical protein
VVEKSTDGSNFSPIGIVAVNEQLSGIYNYKDSHPSEGINYYRIKEMGKTGELIYSDVVKVDMGSLKSTMNIYPNPVVDGILHLQLHNEPAGRYQLRLLNDIGQLIAAKEYVHGGGNGTATIKWNYHLAHGVYQLQITQPDQVIKIIRVLY